MGRIFLESIPLRVKWTKTNLEILNIGFTHFPHFFVVLKAWTWRRRWFYLCLHSHTLPYSRLQWLVPFQSLWLTWLSRKHLHRFNTAICQKSKSFLCLLHDLIQYWFLGSWNPRLAPWQREVMSVNAPFSAPSHSAKSESQAQLWVLALLQLPLEG